MTRNVTDLRFALTTAALLAGAALAATGCSSCTPPPPGSDTGHYPPHQSPDATSGPDTNRKSRNDDDKQYCRACTCDSCKCSHWTDMRKALRSNNHYRYRLGCDAREKCADPGIVCWKDAQIELPARVDGNQPFTVRSGDFRGRNSIPSRVWDVESDNSGTFYERVVRDNIRSCKTVARSFDPIIRRQGGDVELRVAESQWMSVDALLANTQYCFGKSGPPGTFEGEWIRPWKSRKGGGGAAIEAGPQGSLYVGGQFDTAEAISDLDERNEVKAVRALLRDAVVRKYDSTGQALWTRNLATSKYDTLEDVALGPRGSIFAVGQAVGTKGPHDEQITYEDYYLARIAPDGSVRWRREFGSPNSDYAYGVATDSNQYVYVVGETFGEMPGIGSVEGISDGFLAKFAPDGGHRWNADVSTGAGDRLRAVTVGDRGRIYVAGDVGGPVAGREFAGGTADAVVAGYRTDGTRVWARLLGTSDGEEVTDVAADSSRVYVTGSTPGALDGTSYNGGVSDGFVASFTRFGSRSWTRLVGTGSYDIVNDVAIEPSGGLRLAGTTSGNLGTGNDLSLKKDGFLMLTTRQGVSTDTHVVATPKNDTAAAVGIGRGGASYLTGASWGQWADKPADSPQGGYLAKFR